MFVQDPYMTEQHGLVILVSDVIGSFVNKGTVVHTDKEPDWQVNEEKERGEAEGGMKAICLGEMGDKSFILLSSQTATDELFIGA